MCPFLLPRRPPRPCLSTCPAALWLTVKESRDVRSCSPDPPVASPNVAKKLVDLACGLLTAPGRNNPGRPWTD